MVRKLLFFLLFSPLLLAGQKTDPDSLKADSLLGVLARLPEGDTARIRPLLGLAYYWNKNNTLRAFRMAKEAEKLASQAGNKDLLSRAYISIGSCYDNFFSYDEALDYYYKALPLAEEVNNPDVLIKVYNPLGIIYSNLKNYQEALKYFKKGGEIANRLKNQRQRAFIFNNIGITYKNLGKPELSINFYEQAIEIFKNIENEWGMATAYLNISVAKLAMGDKSGSRDYILKGMEIFRKTGDIRGISIGYTNLGEVMFQSGEIEKARMYYDSAMVICEKSGDLALKKEVLSGLADVHREKKDFQKAFHYYQSFIKLRDSLFGIENSQKAAGLESRYLLVTAEKELDLMKKNEEISELKYHRTLTFSIILALAVASLGLISYLVFQRYKVKQRAAAALEIRNQEILHQKKEITDSINYARRIQDSILPPDDLIKKYLPESFVLYLPKDIVSGDFYWLEPSGRKVLFAAVDCTGHGVPGAMMSVLGFNLIHQAVNEKKLTEPGKILTYLDHGVNMTLRQSTMESSVKDGMDLAICCWDPDKNVLEFAGAYNNLWLLRNNGTMEEYKADKKVIGSNIEDIADEFTNHVIPVSKGDTAYIFSDGYADQFGGPAGKKFKYRPLKEMLASLQNLSMEAQKAELEKTIIAWQGNQEQVDDILVFGVRF